MSFYKLLTLYIFSNLLILKIYGQDRLICTRLDTNEIVNFYIAESKLYLSGLSVSGTYAVLTKNNNGVLAVNISNIGKERGREVIFLNFNKNTFSLKSNISNNSNNSLIEIKGSCQ